MSNFVSDKLVIGPLWITFNRTLRLPDDGKIYPLPPSLGRFPIRKVSDFSSKVPSYWLKTGGYFFPMYNREAMWINLKLFLNSNSWKKKALKIGVGGVNVITGEKLTLELDKEKQDYIVLPEQPWIDGINAGDDYVKQFIATRMGDGYSIEKQITGREEKGGIQFIIYDAKKEVPIGTYGHGKALHLSEEQVNMMKKGGNMKIYVKTLTGVTMMIDCSENWNILMIKYRIHEKQGIPPDQQRLILKGYDFDDEEGKSLSEVGITNNSTLYLVLKLRGGGDPMGFRGSMGIGSGGKMKQKIIKDHHGVEYWDQSNPISVFVHICNSSVYQSVTGESNPPETKISAETYTELGMPWFDYYEENKIEGVEKSEILSSVKTVKEILLDDQHQEFTWPKEDQENETVKIKESQVIKVQKKGIFQVHNIDKKKVCGSCGKEKKRMKKCARCKKVRYCNRICQKSHWKVHKKDCSI